MAADTLESDRRTDYPERVLRVLVHIQRNLDDDLPLDELAEIACFSPFHFHRIFTGMVGEPVARHIRRLKLERAANRLKHTRREVLGIALEAGYESHAAFTRAFRAAYGISPTDFRAARLPALMESASGVHYDAGSEPPAFSPVSPEDNTMDVEIRSLEPTRVAFLRHVGPYDEVGSTWERLTDWVGRECLFGPDVRFFGMCWDDPEVTPPDRIRYDACVTVDETVEPEGEIGLTTVEGGRFAVVLHQGPYDRLGETYAALLGRWFPRSGHSPGDPPSLELYLNDPDGTEPEELLTEIWMPTGGSR